MYVMIYHSIVIFFTSGLIFIYLFIFLFITSDGLMFLSEYFKPDHIPRADNIVTRSIAFIIIFDFSQDRHWERTLETQARRTQDVEADTNSSQLWLEWWIGDLPPYLILLILIDGPPRPGTAEIHQRTTIVPRQPLPLELAVVLARPLTDYMCFHFS